MSRVYETVIVLGLIGIMVLGLAYVFLALTNYQESSFFTMLSRYFLVILILLMFVIESFAIHTNLNMQIIDYLEIYFQ